MLTPRSVSNWTALGLAAVLCAANAFAAHNPNPAPPTPEQVLLVEAALPSSAPATPKQPRKVLIFWLCEGFFHNAIPVGNLALSRLGEKTGAYESVISDDPAMLRAENLAQFDALLFNSTTNLRQTYEDPALRTALLDFVNGGKGIAGVHAAADNFGFWPEAACMIGGVFAGHPWNAGGTWAVKLDEPEHPLNEAFGGAGFLIRDEIYWWRPEPYSRKTLRVLTSLDFSNERNYEVKERDKLHKELDVGITWYQEVGKGRVFYCSLGHNPDIYWNRDVLRHYLAGIQYALGDNPLDATPSAELTETPKAEPFAEMAKDGWTHLTRAGLGAWRLPKGDWRVFGDAKSQTGDTKMLAGAPGKGVILNGATGRTSNLLSRTEHGDIEAHIEFMVPEGSNSGIYFQGRYEIQVFDSYGKATPTYTDCGGIYQRWNDAPGLDNAERGFEGHAPAQNAATAPGTWQRFEVQFQAPRFDGGGRKTANAKFLKVVHNGVVIHENVEVTGPTRAARFADERAFGPLMLQGDHGPVAYRNLRIRPLALAKQTAALPEGSACSAVLAYDFGKNTTPLREIEAAVREATPAKRREIEGHLLVVLQDNATSFAAKQFVCRVLGQIGSVQAVPALSDLLYDAELSDMARLALESMPYPKVDVALRTAIRHTRGTTQLGVINSVAARRDAKAVELLASIAEPGASVRPEAIAAAEAAIAALGKIGTVEAANYLRPGDPVRTARKAQTLAHARETARQRAVINARARLGEGAQESQLARAGDSAVEGFDAQSPQREAISMRLEKLRTRAYLQCADGLSNSGATTYAKKIYAEVSVGDHDEAHRAAAYLGLARVAPDQAMEIVAALLREECPALLAMGGRLASQIGGADETLELAQQLPALQPASQALLLAALGARCDSRAESALRWAIGSKDEGVRTAALRALATAGNAMSVPGLLNIVAEGGTDAELAADSLLRIPGEDVDAVLLVHAQQGAQPLRPAAIRALERRRVQSAVPLLMQTAVEGEPEARNLAYAALGTMATEKELPQLLEQLRRAGDPRVRESIEQALTATALRAQNREHVATLLLQALPSASVDVQVSLINILGRLQTDSALLVLRAQYDTGNADIKKAVLRAMGAWLQPAPAAMLEQLAAIEPDRACRILALRGYIDLIKLPSERTAGSTVLMFSRALSLAERPEEKKAVLGLLTAMPSRAALELAARHVEDPAVREEAEAAVEAIRKSLGE